MKKIVILGNGPSIKFVKLFNKKNTIFIGTNNIYLKKNFSFLNNQYYTVYDKRFLKKRDWFNFLKSYRGNIFLPKNWQLKKNIKNKFNKLNFLFPNYNSNKKNLIKKFKKKYCNSKDLEGTVLIEMAIPLAIALGANKILLYGCELNYKLVNNKLNYNSYFYPKINNKEYFDHNKKTSQTWSKIQVDKIKNINLFLKLSNIRIIDFSLYGKLSYLRTNDEKCFYD